MHGRPKRVGFQSQQQFEDSRVGFWANIAELWIESLGSPGLQPPIFIVKKDAAILHRRRTFPARASGDKQIVMMSWRHIGPPVPRRDTDCLRQLKNAECRTAPVATNDHQTHLNVRHWTRNRHDHETLPKSAQLLDVEFAAMNERINERTLAERANDYRVSEKMRCITRQRRLFAGYELDIFSKVLRSDLNHFEIF